MYWLISLFTGAVLITLGIWFIFEEVFLAWMVVASNFLKALTWKAILTGLFVVFRRFLLIEIPKFLLKILLRIGMPIRIRARFRLGAYKLRKKIKGARDWIKKTMSGLFGKHVALGIGVIVSVGIFVIGAIFLSSWLFFVGLPKSAIAWLTAPIKRWVAGVSFKLFMKLKATWVGKAIIAVLPKAFVARIQESLRMKWLNTKRRGIALRKRTMKRIGLERKPRKKKVRLSTPQEAPLLLLPPPQKKIAEGERTPRST